MLSAFPEGPKDPNFRGQAEHVTRFFLHVEPRGQAGDCGRLRTNNAGFVSKDSFDETALWLPDSHHTHGNPGGKGRTGQVERAVQTCRWQASAIQAMAGEKCEIELPEDQALVPWIYIFLSYIHAAGLLNRYHVHSTTRINPGWSSDEVFLVVRFVLEK